jgi:hypothetical protein
MVIVPLFLPDVTFIGFLGNFNPSQTSKTGGFYLIIADFCFSGAIYYVDAS